MRNLVKYIGMMIVLSPCLLILNESETIVPNLLGLAYFIAMFKIFNK